MDLAESLARTRRAGRKAFVPYVTAGLPGVDTAMIRAMAEAGADAIEVGIPFSDPVMDGPVIQEASRRALAGGTTPEDALGLARRAEVEVPVVLMTYLNPVLAYGEDRFVADAEAAGVAGLIVPDLPVDEAGNWISICRAHDVATIFLAAPNSSPARLRAVADASCGFVYCVSTFGTTGSRDALSGSAEAVVSGLRALTDAPLLVGVGISTPEQARQACRFADGVVVGTALVEPLLRDDPADTLARARSFRLALS